MHAFLFYFSLPYGAIWGNILASAIGLAAGYLLALRRFNCAARKCWRIGTQKVPGTTYRTCHHHTTADHHATLHKAHAIDRPEQHDYLN